MAGRVTAVDSSERGAWCIMEHKKGRTREKDELIVVGVGKK
jgi:hypothetical protein